MITTPAATEIIERLKDVYGEPARTSSGDPIAGLVGTILSQSTTDSNADLAFGALTAKYSSWDQVLNAPVDDLADTIRQGGLANQKAQTIHRALAALKQLSPCLETSLFDEMSDDAVMSYLTAIRGVGQKTAACVLMFDLERDVLPVDTHIHRVSCRLGLVATSADANKAQHLLEQIVPPEGRYAAHVLLIQHGRRTCSARSPDCPCCNLNDLCAYARQKTEVTA